MYRNREAAHGSNQARHQRWLEQYSTIPMFETMTNGQTVKAFGAIAALFALCFAVLHGAAVFAMVVM